MANDRIHAAQGKGALPIGGAIYCSFISTHFLLSAYFLTVQTYKRMCLITQVYSMCSRELCISLSSSCYSSKEPYNL